MRGHRARLLSDLLEGYDPDARPAKNESYPTVVSVLMTYNELQHLVSIWIEGPEERS